MPDAADVVHHDETVDTGTHALVIGVGRYPHLVGGNDPRPDVAGGMGQLSSPPISARAFADWLLSEYRFPGKELASVALLLGEERPQPYFDPRTNVGSEVAVATINNIVEAVKSWRGRAHSNPENRLIFYFCGHGVSDGTDMALLAADFGADDLNPMEGALDFRLLQAGLKLCAAGEQMFFVDACRTNTDTLISQWNSAGRAPLGGGRRPPELGVMLPATYYATLDGARSHARPGEVSLFSEALLRSLRGAASDDDEGKGDWRVRTGRLGDAIGHFMSRPSFAGKVAKVQHPPAATSPFEVHHLAKDPVVPVYVGCQSREENLAATFVCRRGQQEIRREPGIIVEDDDTGEWVDMLDFGRYEFEALLAEHDVRKTEVDVRPMSTRVRLTQR
jgi:hypothetical protein